MWKKWIPLITQWAQIGNPSHPGLLEIITNWPEGENFVLPSEEDEEQVTHAEDTPPYNQLLENEKQHALFTEGSCHIVGPNQKWKAAVLSPTWQVTEAIGAQGSSSLITELKAVQLSLDITE